MERRRDRCPDPYFSICIPQYNRTPFLLEVLKSLDVQTFRDFEVCISDDCSPDGRQAEVIDFLERSGLSYVFRTQEKNTRYDGNLRAALGLARGRYCFLLGNDDALASPETLAGLHDDLTKHGPVGVVITNYEEFASGQKAARVPADGVRGSGPRVAAGNFRNFSFVSGVLLERQMAQELATDRWDGSEMYQTYVGCRMIASGLPLLGLERITVRKDVQVPGEGVDSYAHKPRLERCPIVERRLPLGQLGRVVADAIRPYVGSGERERLNERILLQLLLLTYPFWIVEYRRVQSWRYALGICLGMRPRTVADGVELSRFGRARLAAVYGLVTACGLTVPVRLFGALQPTLWRLAKAFR